MNNAEKIVEIVAQHLSLKKEQVPLSASFESLGMDSLDRVEIVMKIEEAFDVEIHDEAADELCTVQDLVNYIDAHA